MGWGFWGCGTPVGVGTPGRVRAPQKAATDSQQPWLAACGGCPALATTEKHGSSLLSSLPASNQKHTAALHTAVATAETLDLHHTVCCFAKTPTEWEKCLSVICYPVCKATPYRVPPSKWNTQHIIRHMPHSPTTPRLQPHGPPSSAPGPNTTPPTAWQTSHTTGVLAGWWPKWPKSQAAHNHTPSGHIHARVLATHGRFCSCGAAPVGPAGQTTDALKLCGHKAAAAAHRGHDRNKDM